MDTVCARCGLALGNWAARREMNWTYVHDDCTGRMREEILALWTRVEDHEERIDDLERVLKRGKYYL